MKNIEFIKQLTEELKLSGASKKEIRDFNPILNKLSGFSEIERPYSTKRKFLEEPEPIFWPRIIFAPAAAFILLILIGTASVFASQSSLPGEPLYSIKRLSENAVSSLKPEFRNEMLVRRSREVRELVEKKKNGGFIKKAVEEYNEEKGKTEHSAITIKESRRNIEKAWEKADDSQRKELEEKSGSDSSGKNLENNKVEEDNSKSGKDSESGKDENEKENNSGRGNTENP